MRSLAFPLKSIRTELSFRFDPYNEDEGSFANFRAELSAASE